MELKDKIQQLRKNKNLSQEIFNISLDRLLKDDNCMNIFNNNCNYKTNEVIEFL